MENKTDLTIAGTSFLSTNMLKIWTVMMKKYPMMTKWLKLSPWGLASAIPDGPAHEGANVKHTMTKASN